MRDRGSSWRKICGLTVTIEGWQVPEAPDDKRRACPPTFLDHYRSSKFYRGKKSTIMTQFAAIVASLLPLFQIAAVCLKSKTNFYARTKAPRLFQIWYIMVQSSLRTRHDKFTIFSKVRSEKVRLITRNQKQVTDGLEWQCSVNYYLFCSLLLQLAYYYYYYVQARREKVNVKVAVQRAKRVSDRRDQRSSRKPIKQRLFCRILRMTTRDDANILKASNFLYLSSLMSLPLFYV